MKRQKPIEILTREEVHKLMRACGRGKTGVRNRALYCTLYRSGLRISEALDLREADVDLARGVIRVRKGKGRKARTVGFDPEACDVLRAWLSVRAELEPYRNTPIFCTLGLGLIDPANVRQQIRRHAAKAGIQKRVHPHSLRHTFSVELDREGVPLHEIAALLGHASVATTSVYLAHLEPQALIRRVRSRPSWRSSSKTPAD